MLMYYTVRKSKKLQGSNNIREIKFSSQITIFHFYREFIQWGILRFCEKKAGVDVAAKKGVWPENRPERLMGMYERLVGIDITNNIQTTFTTKFV